LAYANHVTDRFDLRRHILFDARVTAATFAEAKKCWRIKADRGDRVFAKFCIMAVGCLSAANHPPFKGREDFRGPVYHTGEWPHEGVDFTGLRVGIIGTGSSAIQSIPIIAQQAAALTVFQRTATYSVPAWNARLTPEYRQSIKADYPALRAKARARPTGFYFPFNMKPALEASPEERERQYEEAWERGGLPFLGAFGDLLFEKEANDTIAEFARNKIRSIVKDPATLEPMEQDQDEWVEHVNEVSKISLRSTCSSWYVGANIPGRPRVFMPYIGGFPIYVQKCNEVMSNGFEGFAIDGADPRNEAPRVRLTERWREPLDIEIISPAAVAARRVPVV